MHTLKLILLAMAALIALIAAAAATISLTSRKRGRRRPGATRNIMTAASAAIIVVASLGGCTLLSHAADGLSSRPDQGATAATGVSAELLRVVDGDTIAVRPSEQLPATSKYGDEHTVRVLGIDTPEMNKASGEAPECGAEDATRHLAALLDGRREVMLVYDPVSDHTDRFGRSLAYVEIPGAPSIDVGLAQVRDGYAVAWHPKSAPAPQRYEAYAAAQRDAEADRAGSHASCSSIGR